MYRDIFPLWALAEYRRYVPLSSTAVKLEKKDVSIKMTNAYQ